MEWNGERMEWNGMDGMNGMEWNGMENKTEKTGISSKEGL